MLAPVAESASHTTGLGIVCGGFLRAVTDHEPSRETSPFGEVLPLCGQLHLTLQPTTRARSFWESWGQQILCFRSCFGHIVGSFPLKQSRAVSTARRAPQHCEVSELTVGLGWLSFRLVKGQLLCLEDLWGVQVFMDTACPELGDVLVKLLGEGTVLLPECN